MALKFKFRWKRIRVIWRRWRRRVDRFKPDSIQATPYEEKGLRLWKMVIRDEDTQMAYNSEGIRQIEKETLFITVTPNNSIDRYTMTIMDISGSRRSLYELHVEGKSAGVAIESFDDEMQRRMKKVENSKRKLIETDIDKLIQSQDKSLKKQAEERKKKEENSLK
jgi:hypothetical protein